MLRSSRGWIASVSRTFTLTSAPCAAQFNHASHTRLGFASYRQRSIPVRVPARALHIARRSLQHAQVQRSEAATDEGYSDASGSDSSKPITTFDELGTRELVHANVLRALIKDMGLHTMTDIQSATINEALGGRDIIAQAKTGTGKTLAFLLPILQNILRRDPSLAEASSRYSRQGVSPQDIRALIVSPTRELAEQIAEEARRLTKRTSIIVQTAVGGTQKRLMLQQLQRQGCHILVGTPGRLNDILSDSSTGVEAPQLDSFVLDEADRLLDDGFWPEVQRIMDLLPNRRQRDRQTLMFSATIPRAVIHIVRQTLKPGFQFVRTVKEDEEPTHARVQQKVIGVKGIENFIPTLYELCQREQKSLSESGRPFKAIVYFNATALVTYASSIFRNLQRTDRYNWTGDAKILEIHSKLTQAARTRAADTFRAADSAILFSSDVTARGMDFPNVTHVIQVGVPPTREAYIHRIGRTARAGKEGQGWLIHSELERFEIMDRLKDLPLKEDTSLQTASVDMTKAAQLPEKIVSLMDATEQAVKWVDRSEKANVYRAFLGIYSWVRNKQSMLDSLNNLSRYAWGWDKPPAINAMLARKLGIAGLRGLELGYSDTDLSDGGRTRDFNDRRSSPRPGSGYGNSYGQLSSDRDSPEGHYRRDRGGGYGDFQRRGRNAFGDQNSREDFGERRGRDDFGERKGRSGYGDSFSRRQSDFSSRDQMSRRPRSGSYSR